MAALVNSESPYAAAVGCEALNQHGYTDWYLPAFSEAVTLVGNKNVIKNFSTSDYWSSTEFSGNAAYRVYSSGSNTALKNQTYGVRCVRR